jgi:transposase
MPRPTKLTPERQKVILAGIAAGLPRKHAAERAGITERTLRLWLRKAQSKRATAAVISFSSALNKAEADAVARNVAIIQTAAKGGKWTAAAWWLERRYPEEFSSFRSELVELKRIVRELMAAQGGRHATGGAPACGPNPDRTQPDRAVE